MPLNEEHMPESVQEAVELLAAALSHEEQESIRSSDEDDLVDFHFSLGMKIREMFRLWDENKALLKSCGAEEMHPDDAAMVIIRALWQRLQTRH